MDDVVAWVKKKGFELNVEADMHDYSAAHGGLPSLGSIAQPRKAASMAATSIFFIGIIASNARLATSPPLACASMSTRGVIAS